MKLVKMDIWLMILAISTTGTSMLIPNDYDVDESGTEMLDFIPKGSKLPGNETNEYGDENYDYFDYDDYTENDFNLTDSYEAVAWALAEIQDQADIYFNHLKSKLHDYLQTGNYTQSAKISQEARLKFATESSWNRVISVVYISESLKIAVYVMAGLFVVLIVSFAVTICCLVKKRKIKTESGSKNLKPKGKSRTNVSLNSEKTKANCDIETVVEDDGFVDYASLKNHK